MSTRKQLLFSVGIILVATVLLALQLRQDGGSEAEGGMEGHNHAAMVAGGDQPQPVMLDAEGARRIGVAYATVERRVLPSFVEAVGTVAYDETRLTTVNPKIAGWVERLHVDFTGAPVRAGQPLMDVYSPALVTAQEELILAARLVREAEEGRARDNAQQLLESARRRMAYWDVPEEQIQAIESSGRPVKAVTLRAPASGVVVEKNVTEGDQIMPGRVVYRIADLSRVWVEADVFEKDLAQVGLGQEALVTFESYPGEAFRGRVTYVYPTVSVQARTGRIRLELPNAEGKLRPGMFASIRLTASALEPTLVVPRSAVIATGERALVFVQGGDDVLMPREVQMGRTEGRFQELLSGVTEGERVVSSAAFLIDAESNLGGTAMPGMDMGGGAEAEEMDHSGHDTGGAAPTGDSTGGTDHSAHGG